MDLFAPSDVHAASASWRLVANTLVWRSPVVGTVRTAEKIGDAWAVNLKWPPLNDQSATLRRRSRLLAWAVRHRGHANRSVLSIPGYTGPSWAPELFSNNTFGNGTTGWTPDSECALSVQDRVLRVTALQSGAALEWFQSVSLTQYAPHALRGFVVDGRGTAGLNVGPSLGLSHTSIQDYSTTRGMKTVVGVPSVGTPISQFPMVVGSSSGFMAGDFYLVPYASLARCAQVDNSPNAFQRSDEIDNAYWTKNACSVSANADTAPDGTSTMDHVIENSSTNEHFVSRTETRTSAAEDWCVSGMFRRAVGTRDVRLIIGRDGSNLSHCIFNLGAGTAGSVTNVGDNASGRAFIRDMGNGRYYCALVARLAASTSVYIEAALINAGVANYTGDGSSAIGAWRFGAARSSVPLRLGQTTSAATSGTTQPGTGIHLKGLPPSTNELAVEGRWCDVNLQLNRFVAELRSDSAGLGFAEFARPFRVAPADNSPVVFNNPMGRFLLAENQITWDDQPGVFSTLELPFIEDIAA